MAFNPRLYFRSFQKTLIKDNPIILAFIQIMKILNMYSELPSKTKKISKSIVDNQTKLQKAQRIVNLNTNSGKPKSINFVR